MPNWCYTSYKIEGDSKSLIDLYNKIVYLKQLDSPLVKNGFGNIWCGCLVALLGGNWEEVDCRGEITYYSSTIDGTLMTYLDLLVTSAWSELFEWRQFLLKNYPKLRIIFCAEESGCSIFETNDANGEFFVDRYKTLHSTGNQNEETCYFSNLSDLSDYVYSITNIKTDTLAEVKDAIRRYNILNSFNPNGGNHCFFEEIKIVE